MKIPTESKSMWKALRQHGDVQEIAHKSRYHRNTIEAAINGDRCTMDVFIAIRDFYNERNAKLNSSNTAA